MEDAGRGSHRTDATRTHGRSELEAFCPAGSSQQTEQEAGDEGVAGAGAVDHLDGMNARSEATVRIHQQRAAAAARDDDRPHAKVSEVLSLLERIGFAAESFRFIIVGKEVVGPRRDRFDPGGQAEV